MATKVETERIKDRFNYNVFPLGYRVVLKGKQGWADDGLEGVSHCSG